MLFSPSSYGEHISVRRHLLTEENLWLYECLQKSWKDGTTPDERFELLCKIATVFEIPSKENLMRNRRLLYNTVAELKSTIWRLIAIDAHKLEEGAKVRVKGEETVHTIKTIRKDLYVCLAGLRGAFNPEFVRCV